MTGRRLPSWCDHTRVAIRNQMSSYQQDGGLIMNMRGGIPISLDLSARTTFSIQMACLPADSIYSHTAPPTFRRSFITLTNCVH